jgi:hypothetical protein
MNTMVMNRLDRIARRLAAQDDVMTHVFVGINFPSAMSQEQALETARKLLPCNTGDWEVDQHEQDGEMQWMVGNLEMPEWFYHENPDGFENTGDGVTIGFETP